MENYTHIGAYRHPAHDSIVSAISVVEGMYDDTSRVDHLTRLVGERSVEQVLATLQGLAIGEAVKRCVLEQQSLDTLMGLNIMQRYTYAELAGNARRMPEYIDWFAKNANAAFEQPDNPLIENSNKGPALSLGYEIQAGLWDGKDGDCSPHVLDETMRQLPQLLEESQYNDHYTLRTVESNRKPVSYEAFPVGAEGGGDQLRFVWLERRRAVADIECHSGTGDSQILHIAKRAAALVVVGDLPTRTLTKVHSLDTKSLTPDKSLPPKVATAIGNAFEWAMRGDHRDKQPEEYSGVIPESMSYFLRDPWKCTSNGRQRVIILPDNLPDKGSPRIIDIREN